MTHKEMVGVLGRAFSDGFFDELRPLLSEKCKYHSDYSNKTMQGAKTIISRMKKVHSNVDDSCRYTYKEILLDDVIISNNKDHKLCPYALLLYQFSDKKPVAVVVCEIMDDKITNILLSRDKSSFNISFRGEEIEKDSKNDLPSTVTPFTPHDKQVKELQDAFRGQKVREPDEEGELYIWRKADGFMKKHLPNSGYEILESQIFDDCVGYRCIRNGYAYTIFMYAYGKEKTTQLDGEYCSKLKDLDFAKVSIILILYLHVNRYMDGDEIKYTILNYCDEALYDFWELDYVENKPILNFFPRKEMRDLVYKLMYAFNHESIDVYEHIMVAKNPSFCFYGDGGQVFNDAFYWHLIDLHREYGDMKLGYVRKNDVIYSSVPYIDGLGFFGFEVENNTDKILRVYGEPFDGGDIKALEFIRTNQREPEALFDYIPKLVSATALKPVSTERFAVKLIYDNGECRKYVLPIDITNEDKEVVSYKGHIFTNKIWSSVTVIDSHKSRYNKYPDGGNAISFKNGLYISGVVCYEDSEPYSEPNKTNKLVYEDEQYSVRKVWDWKVNSLYEDSETGILKVLTSGFAFNYYGKSTFASVDGERLTSLTFDYIDNFSEELALVAIGGRGYGFVDKKINFVIPMKYDEADAFNNGKAKVRLDNKWSSINKAGLSIEMPSEKNYQEIGEFYEGMCRVTTLKLRFMDLAYHSDYENIAGIWGYVNEKGEEVISPKYIYANDFENGIAIVAKGQWTIDKKWDNEHNQGRYWTEEEFWGGIDKNGNEVIPCIFDEIKHFNDDSDYYMAHFGGWKNGKWGVIDRHGKWVAEPIFEDIGYNYKDGLFTFYPEDKWSGADDIPMGIYDIKQKKVLFEPQFLDINFMDDGDIEVEVYDEALGRNIEKIIDKTGKERFPSVYSSIYSWREPYEVVIRDKDGDKHGLKDKEGNVILPCVYNVPWGGLHYKQKRIIFEQDGKQGLKDFEDNIIIPANYYEIYGIDNPLLTVRDGEKNNYKEGLITHDGKVVIPAKYERISWTKDKKRIICCAPGLCEMHVIECK